MAPKKAAAKKKAASSDAAENETPSVTQSSCVEDAPVSQPSPVTPTKDIAASPRGSKRGSRTVGGPVTPTATDDSAVMPTAAASLEKPRKSAAPASAPAFLDVLVADNIAPASLGITAMVLSRDEHTVVAARTNGSLASYRVLPGPDPAKPIFNFVMMSNTGGCEECTVIHLCLLGEKDRFVVAALGTGQLAVYNAASLELLSLTPRSGGVVRCLARFGDNEIFAACADGSARRLTLSSTTTTSATLEVTAILPKTVSCERALCVAASAELGLVIVGDDARTVTAFSVAKPAATAATGDAAAKSSSPITQLWHAQIEAGYPLAVAISETGNAIAIGTSLNQVLFMDVAAGLVVNTFQHHKGPVTTLTEAAGVFYASGFHEALRAYRPLAAGSSSSSGNRQNNTKNRRPSAADYVPTEVKRRTHYHECTALAVGAHTGLFLSAARDGTIMFANLDKLFTHPASYLDSQPSKDPYVLSSCGNLLFTHREAIVQVYRVLPNALLPLASVTVTGRHYVRGLWTNMNGTLLCVATDERVVVLELATNYDNNTCIIRRLAAEPIPEATGACFPVSGVCCVATGRSIVLLTIDANDVAEVAKAKRDLHALRRRRAQAHRKRGPEDAATEEELLRESTAAVQVFQSDRITGAIHSMVACSTPALNSVFVATHDAAYHFVRLVKDAAAGNPLLIGPATKEAIDCVNVKAMAPGDVSFLCPSDGRHWHAKPPADAAQGYDVLVKKPASLTVPRALLPQNALFLSKYPQNQAMATAVFPGGIVQYQVNGERWTYIRHADRAKADANNIKTKTEFAAFVASSEAAPAPWSAACASASGRHSKRHRDERATIALQGEESDGEGSDDGRREDPTQLAQGVAAEAAAGKRSDAMFVLRRNVEGLLEGLPPMWRVRRFGN